MAATETTGGTEQAITSVLFDADGVVQQSRPGFPESLRRMLPNTERGAEFLRDLSAAELPTLTGERDFLTVMAKVMRQWECSGTAQEMARLWTRLDVSPDVVELISELRAAGVGCYLATNQQAYRAAYMTGELGYDGIFDEQFYSCRIGLAKPNPRFFDHIIAAIGGEPAAALLIDDNEANVLAARSVGLSAQTFVLTQGVARLRQILAESGLPIAGRPSRCSSE